MAGLNKVTIIGHLGADPEVKRMNNGNSCVNLRIATSESWRDKQSGERKEVTEWHSVVIWNEGLGKVAEQYLEKGSKVYIEGKLKTRSWEDQSGQKRYATEIVLEQFRGELIMLDGKNDRSGDGDRGGRGGGGGGRRDDRDDDRGRGGTSGRGGRTASREMDDEIPFAPEWR